MSNKTTNIVIGGLGGQGVISASDVLADAALLEGHDVKKSELHGMSQRGGSVSSDVRYGTHVLSPMVPIGEADILVIVAPDQVDPNIHVLKKDGLLISASQIDETKLLNKKSMNVALLGLLSQHLPDISESNWLAALKTNFKESLHAGNEKVFQSARANQLNKQ